MKLIKKTIHKSKNKSVKDPEEGTSGETIEDIDIVENDASDILSSDLATEEAEAKIKVLQKSSGEETTVELTITKKKTILETRRLNTKLNNVLFLIIFFLTLYFVYKLVLLVASKREKLKKS